MTAEPGFRRSLLGFALVLLGSVGFGVMPLFARWSYADGLSPFGVQSWRFCIAGVFALLFLPGVIRAGRRALLPFVMGFVLAVATVTYFIALTRVSVALAVLIFFTFPLFVIVIERFAYRRRMNWQTLAAAALVLCAVVLIVTPGSVPSGDYGVVLLAFVAPLGYGAFIAVSAENLRDRPLRVRLPAVYLGAFAGSTALMFIVGEGIEFPVSALGWAGVLGLGVVSSTAGLALLVIGAPMTGPARTAIAGTSELITALIVGWLAFAEPMHGSLLLGAALIIVAVVLVAPRPSRHRGVG